jgi:ABC-type uncharacterized transport system substrate-binding protein
VDRVLKGAEPANLVVEQTMRAEFIIKLKVARQISLAIPAEVLQWADKVFNWMLQCEKPSVKRVTFLHR